MEDRINTHFRAIGVPESNIEAFWSVGERKPNTIEKIAQNLPTKQQYDEWCEMRRGSLHSLRRICHPLLCGWSYAEVIAGLKAYIYEVAKKYITLRMDIEDVYQYGCIGVIEAMRTDAGISCFANHAFARIRTSIRRKATSGLIRRPEKVPSRTEVRREVTNWLMENEFIRQEDLKDYRVQKIGQKVSEKHIPESYKLSNLDKCALVELMDHINKFFTNSYSSPNLTIDSDQYVTVADVINKVSGSPDFHGAPKSLTSQDDEYKLIDTISSDQKRPDEIAEENVHKRNAPKLIKLLREKMGLSVNQNLVFCCMFGLDGKPQLENHEIADRFGELLDGSSRKVTRQRISQYQKTIYKRATRALREIFGGHRADQVLDMDSPVEKMLEELDSIMV
jgi:RNA polymerase sigma factor (sigma-70 family)